MQDTGQKKLLIDWVEKHIGELSIVEKENIELAFKEFSSNKNGELTEKVFNKIHAKDKQKKLGITYTPVQIRHEIITRCFKTKKIDRKISDIRICDPACGSGLFVIDIITELLNLNITIEEIATSLHFSDIDRLSVAISLTNIYLHLSTRGVFNQSIKFNVRCIDFFDDDTTYDYIITNPPYVKLQNIETIQREKLKNKYPEIFTGSIGLASLFLMKMHDNLKIGGIVGVITQNNIFTSNSSKSLRSLIQEHLLHIDNFGSEKIFDAVTAYTCLLYLSKDERHDFEYRKIKKIKDFQARPTIITTKELNYEKWRLGTDAERKKLLNMESKGIPLGSVCRIWVGIATQYDKAFTVFKEKGSWFGQCPSGELMPVEKSIVKKLIKISDFNTEENLKGNTRGVIYPYDLKSGKTVAFEENYFKENFPQAYEFLSSWRSELILRDKGQIAKEDWFKWGRVQSMIPVKGKLLTKTFSHGPSFLFDESDALFSNGYALTIKINGFLIEYIQKILNSEVFWDYAKLTSFEIEGDYQCYQKNFIEKFCIPNISEQHQTDLLASNGVNDFLLNHYGIK